jgi:hypothetical protein
VRSKGIASGMPNIPAVINGPASGQCGQSGVSYSINPIAQASNYTWTSSCGTLVGPTNLSGVTVNWPSNFTTCTISVSATNSCGTSGIRNLTVTGAPSQPNAITGNSTPCANTFETYATSGSAGATGFIWTVPVDAVIQGPATGASILVQWGSSGGNITVRATNGCGQSAIRTLVCTMSCRTGQVSAAAGLNTEVYPNPAVDKTTLKFNSSASAAYHLILTDVIGQTVLSNDGTATEGINTIEMNLSTIAKGVYLLSLMSNGSTEQIRLVVE